MADVEVCSPPVADPCGGRCKAALVVTLFSVSLFAGLYNGMYGVASLVAELVAYAAVGCLYIYNSSGRQEKIISAGYLVLVLSAFLLSWIGMDSALYGIGGFVLGANMVAISTYCVWKWTDVVAIPLSRKKIIATILHAAIVTILLALVIVSYVYVYMYISSVAGCLIQLGAYNAVGCLYICSSSRQKEKVISAGFLVVLLFVFLLSSLAQSNLRVSLIFAANVLAISSYCLRKLKPLLRRWFDALDGDPARQEEAVVLHHQPQLTAPPPIHIQKMLREFSSHEIQAMTQDFGSVIGRGGSAQVFRGSLDDGKPVAVKRINIHGGRTVAGEEDFRRELSIIANAHHRSLVRLLGYCLQRGGGLYLVYPFFENGSLDRWIFHGTEEQRRQLTWPKRFCIAVDVARALAYLHNECHWRILHLDVKPGNILLDGDLRAHVSDFGISLSITRRDLNSVVDTEHLKGTFGYMAPEMLYNAVSDKSDVFSYGMTLLELVGGRRNMYPSLETPDLTRDYFPYIVREKMARGEVLGAVDAAMAPADDDEAAVMAVLKVALCCIQNQREMRPSMQTVVDMLEGRVAIDLPPDSRHHLL